MSEFSGVSELKLFIVSGSGQSWLSLHHFYLKRARTHTHPGKRSCILVEPACQRINGVYSEAPCQWWWSLKDTRAHKRPASSDSSWRETDSADSWSKGSNHNWVTIHTPKQIHMCMIFYLTLSLTFILFLKRSLCFCFCFRLQLQYVMLVCQKKKNIPTYCLDTSLNSSHTSLSVAAVSYCPPQPVFVDYT